MAATAGGGTWGEAVAFATVGARMVSQNGPGALFVGMVPRLVQQVRRQWLLRSSICVWEGLGCVLFSGHICGLHIDTGWGSSTRGHI